MCATSLEQHCSWVRYHRALWAIIHHEKVPQCGFTNHTSNRLKDNYSAMKTIPRELVAGDLISVLAVVVLGIYSHHGVPGVLDPVHVGLAAGPFVIGFLVAALLIDAYSDPARSSIQESVRLGAGSAIAGVSMGMVIRGLQMLPGDVQWSFLLVMTSSLTAVIVGWRLCYGLIVRSR